MVHPESHELRTFPKKGNGLQEGHVANDPTREPGAHTCPVPALLTVAALASLPPSAAGLVDFGGRQLGCAGAADPQGRSRKLQRKECSLGGGECLVLSPHTNTECPGQPPSRGASISGGLLQQPRSDQELINC